MRSINFNHARCEIEQAIIILRMCSDKCQLYNPVIIKIIHILFADCFIYFFRQIKMTVSAGNKDNELLA